MRYFIKFVMEIPGTGNSGDTIPFPVDRQEELKVP
jgi:hypothetical protein